MQKSPIKETIFCKRDLSFLRMYDILTEDIIHTHVSVYNAKMNKYSWIFVDARISLEGYKKDIHCVIRRIYIV